MYLGKGIHWLDIIVTWPSQAFAVVTIVSMKSVSRPVHLRQSRLVNTCVHTSIDVPQTVTCNTYVAMTSHLCPACPLQIIIKHFSVVGWSQHHDWLIDKVLCNIPHHKPPSVEISENHHACFFVCFFFFFCDRGRKSCTVANNKGFSHKSSI